LYNISDQTVDPISDIELLFREPQISRPKLEFIEFQRLIAFLSTDLQDCHKKE
jgi:hypothetical protein